MNTALYKYQLIDIILELVLVFLFYYIMLYDFIWYGYLLYILVNNRIEMK